MDKKTEDLYFDSHSEDEKTQDLNYYQTKNDITTDALFYSEKAPEPVERKAKRRCMGCMELIDENDEYCENCGYLNNDESTQPLNIKPGTIIGDKYIVGKSIGSGGFGVTYIGWDTVLERKVAIKEYLPSEFATRCYGQTQVTVFSGEKADQFAIGRQKFVEEAKRLAKFKSENGIVKIYDSFEENETAYIVMEYLDGETLAKFIQREGKVSPEKAVEMMMPVIEALEAVNEAGIIHRDIAPDNILLTKTGEIKLIDFGAARYATTTHSKSLTVIIKPGYSAEEQYRSRGEQGPHTDVYSVGAVLYKLITGETPPDALERRATFQSKGKDILKPIHKVVKNVPPNIETAIHNAMNVRIEDRTPDMINLAGELLSEEPVKRRDGKISKIDVLTWPLWAKIGVPSGFVVAVTLCLLLAFGVIGPRSRLQTGVEIPDGMTLVPDVITYDVDDAEKELGDKDLKLIIGDKRNDEKIKENTVLLQDPDAGNMIGIGSFIKVTISAGATKEYVIDVKDYTLDLAKKELEALGFTVETKEEYNSDIAPGAVISQSVQEGEALSKGSVITLVISKGDKNAQTGNPITIPNITGTQFEEAKANLKKQSLYVAINELVYSDTLPKGQIVGQTPVGGESGKSGDVIKVAVNMGSKQVYMPDVTYRTEEEAVELLESHGLSVKVERVENKDVAAGTVFKQSVAAGQKIDSTSTIIITVSNGYTVSVPNVTGMELEKAQETLMQAGVASTVTYQKSTSVPKDHVISQSIASGTKVNQGTNVNLVISTGNEEAPQTKEELAGISINSTPNKKIYYIGDEQSLSGLSVIATYSNGVQTDITSKCTFTGFDSLSAGTKTITAKYTENGVSRTASFAVTVKVPEVSINRNNLTISDKSSVTLSAETSPSGQSVSWKSSNPAVATVSGGMVKGVKEGRAEITASISYNGKVYTSQSCTVDVLATEIPVSGITLNQSSKTLETGDSFRLNATVLPTNATNQNVSWSSSNPSVASVSGGTVTAKTAGTTVITAKAGSYTAKCTVTVNVKKVTVPNIKGDSWNEAYTTLKNAGLNPVRVYCYSSTYSSGLAAYQSVGAGNKVVPGTTVNVAISKGDANNAWSGWSTSKPSSSYESKSGTQYRYRTRTSEQVAVYGSWGATQWYTSQQSTSDTVQYVGSRQVETQKHYKTQYRYSHWTNGERSYPTWSSGTSQHFTDWSDNRKIARGSTAWQGGSYTRYGDTSNVWGYCGSCGRSYFPWYNEETRQVYTYSDYRTEYGYQTRSKSYETQYSDWGSWSSWSFSSASSSSTKDVETRTVYSYREKLPTYN